MSRARSILFDLLVVAGVVGLTSLNLLAGSFPRQTTVFGYVMALALTVRRRWPLVTMGVVAGAALLQVILFDNDPLPYDLAVLIAMYSVVKYGRHLRDAAIAGVVVAIGIAIEVVRHPEQPWLPSTLWYLGFCGGVWLMGYSMRNRRLYVATLEERAATLERERHHLAQIAVADERAAIARELHDVVAHSLAVMIVQADGGRYAFDRDPDQARQALKTVADTGREALADMRRLVEVLRGSSPDDEPHRTRDGLETLVERARSAGVDVSVTVTGSAGELPPAVELSVFRIVQEALTNVLRHAGSGARVELGLGYASDAVTISVVDDGGTVQVRPQPPGTTTGHGLVGMRERVNVHGGTFSAGPAGAGWVVTATIPVRTAVPA